jgi:4'-phosphopantetheinyl transferase
MLPDELDHEGVLGDDERHRMRRLRRADDRRRFAARRAGLRQVLAAYLDQDPGDVVIFRSCRRCGDAGHGRPRLYDGAEISFNTASRAGLAVVAVGDAAMSVGVDVERVADVDPAALRATALSAGELEDLAGGSPAAAARLWCRKEAVLKAQGVGLAGPSPAVLDVRAGVVGGWQLIDLPLADGWVGALATADPVTHLFVAHWSAQVSRDLRAARRSRAR